MRVAANLVRRTLAGDPRRLTLPDPTPIFAKPAQDRVWAGGSARLAQTGCAFRRLP